MEENQRLIKLLTPTLVLLPLQLHASELQEALDPSQRYKSVMSATLILTESDVVSVGFNYFDPNKIFGTNNGNLGGSESIDTSKRISTTSLPTTFYLGDKDGEWLHRVKLRAAWLSLLNEYDYTNLDGYDVSDWQPDRVEDKVVSGYAEYALGYKITPSFEVYVGSGLHLMHYQNEFDDKNNLSDLADELGYDHFLNTNTNAWVVEPQLDFVYSYPLSKYLWQFKSEYHYVYGENFGGSGGDFKAYTQGWRISNSGQFKYHLPNLGDYKQDLLFRIRRTDVGGDLRVPLDATNYTEYSFGWLFDTSRFSSLIYNIGLGININYGSSLKGGSLVFFYNE
jgi:hypothetical protein